MELEPREVTLPSPLAGEGSGMGGTNVSGWCSKNRWVERIPAVKRSGLTRFENERAGYELARSSQFLSSTPKDAHPLPPQPSPRLGGREKDVRAGKVRNFPARVRSFT